VGGRGEGGGESKRLLRATLRPASSTRATRANAVILREIPSRCTMVFTTHIYMQPQHLFCWTKQRHFGTARGQGGDARRCMPLYFTVDSDRNNSSPPHSPFWSQRQPTSGSFHFVSGASFLQASQSSSVKSAGRVGGLGGRLWGRGGHMSFFYSIFWL
jgi:hypothetical protein